MLLDDYLTRSNLTDAAFAEKIEIGRSMVTKLRHRKAKPSFDTAMKIEKATGGRVSLKDLAPIEDAPVAVASVGQ